MLEAGAGVQIDLRNVTKQYPGQELPAVEAISLTVPAGEICVLVGPSGCGKTTTMKMVNRLIEPTSGEVAIGGEDVLALDPDELRRRVGYVIQQTGLFPHMTVGQNIALVPRLLRWDKARVAARVLELLELVGLDPTEYADRFPRQLSGGQQQRVGVARALAADPPVLLMDEPFGATDPITRDRLQNEFLRLQQEVRKTILFVTHDFDEALKLGDRIAVLRDRSVIAQYDTPAAILAAPADEYVASFIGRGASIKRLAITAVGDATLLPVPGRLPELPSVTRTSSLRDALDLLIGTGAAQIAVTDDQGQVIGLLDFDAVRAGLSAQRRVGLLQ